MIEHARPPAAPWETRALRQGKCEGCYRKCRIWLNCGALGLLCNECYEAAYSALVTRYRTRQARAAG
jgi:protein-arginine kinase activator protein McsA